MPELPEVETVRLGLEKSVVGQTVKDVTVLLPKSVWSHTPAEFTRMLQNHVIESIDRRGKYLLIFLSGSLCLVVHLRMTGRFDLVPADSPRHPHTRIILHLEQGYDLRFIDMRTFGGMQLSPSDKWSELAGLSGLGPEPLSEKFTAEYMQKKAHNRILPVKSFLLDQKIVAGIGNIYADESLFLAQIHPRRPAGSLSAAEWKTLNQAIRSTLTAGILHRGTSVQTHQNLDGRPGSYQDRLQVYGRTGCLCPRCQTPIVKIRTGGRGTHYCPCCQPLSS